MYVERSAGAAFVARAGCRWRALRLAPEPQRAAVGAAWFELGSHAGTPLASHEGDRVVIVLAGDVELRTERECEPLGAGDAALVFDARSCTVRALDGGARALAVWLEGEPEAAAPHVAPQRAADAPLTDEFNTRFRRLPLLPQSAAVDWGAAIAHLAPADRTTPAQPRRRRSVRRPRRPRALAGGNRVVRVRAGDVVHLPSGAEHTLREPRAARRARVPVHVVDRFRAPSAHPDEGLGIRYLVTATPPTTNGDLHLGHLSGPYLAADVFTRFARLARRTRPSTSRAATTTRRTW